jgi:xylan 1,4-beta-xylosidase
VQNKFCIACLLGLSLLSAGVIRVNAQAAAPEVVEVDTQASAHPFPHFWEQMFGSGRAILSLRQSYRDDLREVKSITDFQYVRFHAIFHDEVGFYDEDAAGNPVYNFSYIDQIYDGLLQNHVRPFVELSFMPKKLAAANNLHAFWYKQNVSPPKDYDRWSAMISVFAKHLVDRYGIEEVSKWYFEVWNEPNIDFWTGDPKELTYYHLYDVTAAALKSVNPRLRVGGPATAQAAWVDRFIRHCADNKVPVDFVSTHVYGNDTSHDVFGNDTPVPLNKMICGAVDKVHNQIKFSAKPDLPLIWSEVNAVYDNEPQVEDTAFMGPWLGDTIRQCDGLVNIMSYWTFSDVFEEQGVVKLMHHLGDQRIDVASDSMIVTRRADGSLALAVWNYSLPDDPGHTVNMTIHLKQLKSDRQVEISELDAEIGSPLPAYYAMGDPLSPTIQQYAELKKAAELPPARIEKIKNGTLHLALPPKSLFLIEIH